MYKIILAFLGILLLAGSTLAQVTTGGGGGTSSAQGPVINVNTYGASPSLGDNATAFAAAAAASNAASLTAGPVTRQTFQNFNCTSFIACTSVVVPVSGTAGDTVIVQIVGTLTGRTFTITENGTSPSVYFNIIPWQSSGGNQLVYATAAGGLKSNFTSITITDSGAAENINGVVYTYRNVGSYRLVTKNAAGNSTAPAFTQATNDTNNLLWTGLAWYSGGVTSASANVGTVIYNTASSAAQDGWAGVEQTSASIQSVTNSMTLSGSSSWLTQGIELRSRTDQMPTFYVPAGVYNYSSGLNFLQPVQLKCEPGGTLDYTGNAHAVDFGPTNLFALGNLVMYPFIVDGCTFIGGELMTAGIYGQPYTIVHAVRNTRFHNFGNSTAFMMDYSNNNWDIEIGPQFKVHVDDGSARNIFRNSSAAADAVSYVRIHDGEAFCITSTLSTAAGCSEAQTGQGFLLAGLVNVVSGTNNFAYFKPVIRFMHSTGNGAQRLIGAMIEPPGSGSTVPPVQFAGVPQQGLEIEHTSFIMHGAGVSPIGPASGTDTCVGCRFNYNTAANLADTQAFVQLNNLAGQTNNQSSNNLTSTALFTSLHPAVIPHTTGSNISNFSFNVDDQHVAGLYATTTNCAVNTTSPAACAAAAAGVFAVPTTTTTYTINTTAVTANSRIFLEDITDNTGIPSTPTCTALAAFGLAQITSRVAGTSFTISLPSTAGTTCFNFWIVN